MVYKIFYYQSEQHPHAIGGKVGPVACAVGGQICLSQLYHATHQNGRHHTYQGQAALVPFIAVALVFTRTRCMCQDTWTDALSCRYKECRQACAHEADGTDTDTISAPHMPM